MAVVGTIRIIVRSSSSEVFTIEEFMFFLPTEYIRFNYYKFTYIKLTIVVDEKFL